MHRHVHGVKVNCMPICIPIVRNFLLSLTLMKGNEKGTRLLTHARARPYFSQIFKTIECQISLSYFKTIEPQMAY